MPVTPQQKRRLKARGQTLPEHARLGHEPPTDAQLNHLRQLLAKHELVKLRFADLEGSARKAFAASLADSLDAQCVHVLGRTMLMYKERPQA